MTFGEATKAMLAGKNVSRDEWTGRRWIRLLQSSSPGQRPFFLLLIANPDSLRPVSNVAPFVEEDEAVPDAVPWAASHDDLLASDWREI